MKKFFDYVVLFIVMAALLTIVTAGVVTLITPAKASSYFGPTAPTSSVPTVPVPDKLPRAVPRGLYGFMGYVMFVVEKMDAGDCHISYKIKDREVVKVPISGIKAPNSGRTNPLVVITHAITRVRLHIVCLKVVEPETH